MRFTWQLKVPQMQKVVWQCLDRNEVIFSLLLFSSPPFALLDSRLTESSRTNLKVALHVCVYVCMCALRVRYVYICIQVYIDKKFSDSYRQHSRHRYHYDRLNTDKKFVTSLTWRRDCNTLYINFVDFGIRAPRDANNSTKFVHLISVLFCTQWSRWTSFLTDFILLIMTH